MITTVNDLIGLNYANLRNPTVPQLGVNQISPEINRDQSNAFSYTNELPPLQDNFQKNAFNYVNEIPPMLANTTGIAPLLQQEMPLDYEEMIQEDKSIVPQKNKGLNSLFQLALSAVAPGAGLLMGGARGLAGLNRRIQQSDFGQSSSLVDYLNRKRRQSDKAIQNMVQTRGIQKKIDSGMYDDKDSSGIRDRNRGQNIPSAPKAPQKTSSSYTTASQDRKKG